MDTSYIKYILLLCFGILYTSVFQHQTILKGRVLSSKTQKALKGVQIVLQETQQTVQTDDNGYFSISPLQQKKRYNIHCFLLDYGLKDTSLNSETHTIIYLEPLAEHLSEIVVKTKESNIGNHYLRAVEGVAIHSGKHTHNISPNRSPINTAKNNAREVYKKVSGLNIWDNGDAGVQVNIGTRGLDPRRSANFNTRQNSYDISADALGYPESYYTPPPELIEEIHIVKGASSLQYGTQFGGLLNFKLHKGNTHKPIHIVSQQSLGSYELLNISNSIGGTIRNINYYVFHQYKGSRGWRPNSALDSRVFHGAIIYSLTHTLDISAEYTHFNYLAKQPGGLTDNLFTQDPKQSIRDRNWFKVSWNVGSIVFKYTIRPQMLIQSSTFFVHGQRNALGILGNINRTDPLTERVFLQDNYFNIGNETKYIYTYTAFEKHFTHLIGVRLYQGQTEQYQGLGDASHNANFSFLHPDNLEKSAYTLPSKNIAIFNENILTLYKNFTIVPGWRWEYIQTQADGYYRILNYDLSDNIISDRKIYENITQARQFFLFGLGSSYTLNQSKIYTNITQNYRAITFNDLKVSNPNLQIDPNIGDETGYSFDIGYQTYIKNSVNIDVNLFYIYYRNKIGEILRTDPFSFAIYRYRTNLSRSHTYGIESLIEIDIPKLLSHNTNLLGIILFTNLSILEGRYTQGTAIVGGNSLEFVPNILLTSGIEFSYKNLQLNIQYRFTSRQFTDATNSLYSPTAITGIIPAYSIWDCSIQYSYSICTLSFGVNNITNNSYFTQRASGYPGPGILPAEPINAYITLKTELF